MMEWPVLTRLLLLLFLLSFHGSAAVAAEQPGPYLYDLMKQEAYVTAWKTMLGPDVVPDRVKTYADTLDGPATPSITVPVGGDSYTLNLPARPMIAAATSSMCCSHRGRDRLGGC
jgi:hypothetical protein